MEARGAEGASATSAEGEAASRPQQAPPTAQAAGSWEAGLSAQVSAVRSPHHRP